MGRRSFRKFSNSTAAVAGDGYFARDGYQAFANSARIMFLRQRFDKSAAEKHTDQVALVVGAALDVVDRIGGLG